MQYLALNLEDQAVNPLAKFNTIAGLVNVFVPLSVTIAALIFLALLLYAGFTIVTSGNSSENIVKAQKIATWSIIGLMVIIGSYSLMRLIAWMLNIQLPF